MKVEYSSGQDGRCEANLTEDSDWQLFNGVADAILRKFKGKFVEKLDGLDQRYWDIEIGEKVVTLRVEHYTGIFLCANDVAVNDLVREIGGYLEGIEPKKMYQEVFYLKNIFRIRPSRWTKG
ncbi:MAG TPA: DUF3630 family protein [Pyrinomonadaceae bacterium]|nr:DUF3630 family protein [Pyrinomonadaceae bacterium]